MLKTKGIRATFGKVISLLLAVIVLFTMFVACDQKTPKEEFVAKCANACVQTDGCGVLKTKSVELLEKNGIDVIDAFVDGYFLDEVPVIELVVLVHNGNGSAKILSFEVEVDHAEILVSSFLEGRNESSSYDDLNFNIPTYLRSCTYSLDGEKIVVSY